METISLRSNFAGSRSFTLKMSKHRPGYTQFPTRVLIPVLFFLSLSISSFAQNTLASHLGPFQLQVRTDNPLREPFHFTSKPNPVSVDMDKDGDRDLVMADFYGGNGFFLLRNDGNQNNALYNYALLYDNPFYYTPYGNGGTPAFIDLDKDGDLDMLLGLMDGTIRYYRNNSTKTNAFTQQTGVWNSVTKAGNPFNGVDLGDYAAPVAIDFDSDGDQDLVIGTSYLPNYKSISYYVNDGEGNFTVASLQGINPASDETTPALLDVDGDGAIDILTGGADGTISFFKRTGVSEFTQKTGTDNPFQNVNKGIHNSPTAGDLDGDGDADLIFGVENLNQDLFYYENKGNGIFEEKLSFDNPFGGITIIRNSAPFFVDLDGDDTKEVVIAGWYGNQKLKVLKNENEKFVETIAGNPFSSLTFPNKFYPSFVDIDSDGDNDLIGGGDTGTGNAIEFYRNDNGNFVRQTYATGPFSGITIDEGKTDFVDIDNDGDFDLFISDFTTDGYNEKHFVRFYRNTGTAQACVFAEATGTQNPLVGIEEQFRIFPRFFDVDHDGDFDAILGEGGGVIENSDGNEFSFYENTGGPLTPIFKYRGDLIEQGDAPTDPTPAFFDHDNDGDLDMFVGGFSGDISFYKNTNPAAVLSMVTSDLNLSPGAAATFIDNTLTLTDSDNDSIVFASVSISDYQQGRQLLSFTAQPEITSSFDNVNGILSFKGKAPISVYQMLLRSVTFEYKEASASGRINSTSVLITINAADADGTRSTSVSRKANLVSNQAPAFADASVSVKANATASINLKSLVTDANNNVDYTTFSISIAAPSGATTDIDANGLLNINYASTTFAGSETITAKICDLDGACDQSVITINVTNTSPTFNDTSATLSFGKSTQIDLTTLISDQENNIDWTGLVLLAQPLSGAVASFNNTHQLTVDYTGKNFTGTETITAKVCDKIGSCDNAVISITVTNSAPVLNSSSATIVYGGKVSVDLKSLMSDNESNIDINSLQIVNQPKSGAIATIDSNQKLILDFSTTVFAGNDQVEIKVCDLAKACVTNFIAVTVTNTPPSILSESFSAGRNSIKVINIFPLLSDAENNLQTSSMQIVGTAKSGVNAILENPSPSEINIVLDYTDVSFTGIDAITLKVCDVTGACAENVIYISVEDSGSSGLVEVFNAIAPNSSGDNKFMRILNLPSENKVQIFNRWGDEVFSMKGYNHEMEGRRFEGANSSGSALASGTYFYKIEYFDSLAGLKTITGYVSLKQ